MDDFIDLKALSAMTDAELLAAMEEAGMIAPWGALQMQAAESVMRMTELPPGSPAFTAAVNGIISKEARKGLVGMTRRATQQFTTLNDMAGDTNKEFIWIVEGDDSTCAPCMVNAAMIKTYAEWEASGLPGAATCDGGDFCRCDLLPA